MTHPSAIGRAALAQKSGAAAQGGQARGDPFVGTFRGERLIVALERSGNGYAGVGTSTNGQYQLRVQRTGRILLGSYIDGGALTRSRSPCRAT